jgi:flagellar secretion chaperone FliS
MNHSEIASYYRDVCTRGSNPVGLVVRLYGAILEDFRRAMNAAAERNIEKRTASLNHALQIITELQNVLDYERGKEVARRLNGLYDVTRMLIMEANIHSDPQRIQKLLDMYLPLYDAWRRVEQEAAAGKLQFVENSSDAEQPISGQIVPSNESNGATDLDASRARWNA